MPETTGNKVLSTAVLTRSTPLSTSDWVVLIEDRLAMMKPLWSEVATKELGDVYRLRSCSTGNHRVSEDGPTYYEVFPDGSRYQEMPNSRAIYSDPMKAKKVRIPGTGYMPVDSQNDRGAQDGVLIGWRMANPVVSQWQIVRVHFVGIRDPNVDTLPPEFQMNVDGWYSGYEKATRVEVTTVSCEDLISVLKLEPREIWDTLGDVVKHFANHRRRLYKSLKRLDRRVRHEEEMMCHIPN